MIKIHNTYYILKYMTTNNITTNSSVLNDIRTIIEHGRQQAYAAAGQAAIVTYWNVGRRIVEEGA